MNRTFTTASSLNIELTGAVIIMITLIIVALIIKRPWIVDRRKSRV